MEPGSSPLLTDLYQLNMIEAYLAHSETYDFCVRYFAEDATREGFEVVIVEDARQGIDVDGSMAATRESLKTLGVVRTTTEAVG